MLFLKNPQQFNILKPFSTFSVSVDLKYIFLRFKVEKVRSGAAVVSEIAAIICSSNFILGTISVQCKVKSQLSIEAARLFTVPFYRRLWIRTQKQSLLMMKGGLSTSI